MHQRVGRIEAHRLLVEQRAEKLGVVVHAQPGGLVGQQAEGSRVGLGKAEAGEAHDLAPDPLGRLGRGAALDRAGQELLLVGAQGGLRALAAHRPPQPLGLAGAKAGEGHRHLEHLVLEDDRAQRVAQHRLQHRMLVGHLEIRVGAQRLAPLDVGMHRAAHDRPRAHQRHLHGDVVEVLGARALEHLHLRARLDLEDPHRLRVLDAVVDLGVVVGDARQVDALAAHAFDLDHAALDGGEHPQAEQVDLQKAGVAAGVLVPLHHLAALHRGGLHRAEVDQGLGRDDHPARVLGAVAGQAPGVAGQLDQGVPARRALPAPVALGHLLLDVVAVLPGVDRPGQALDLPGRQAERLGEVAHRRAHLEGRVGGHQRAAVAPVAVVHAGDQDVADVAREVEVDVGQRGDLVVEKAAQQQLVGDRVDVREAGEVADDRGHARAPPPPRRQQAPRGLRPAHLAGHLARQLEHVAVQQEEARQAEMADHPQLLLQARLRVGAAGIALLDLEPAQLGELAVGVGILRARVAVAQVLGQVEAQALGQQAALLHRALVLAKALGHALGWGEHVRGVAAPPRLGLVEGRAHAHRDHRVLQRGALTRVHVDVAGGHAGHAEALGQLGQQPVAAAVVAPEGALELHAKAIGTEDAQQPPGRRRGAGVVPGLHARGHRAVAGAARQAHQPLRAALDVGQRDARLLVDRVLARTAAVDDLGGGVRPALARPAPGMPMRGGDQPAQVGVALAGLAQEGEVAAVVERDLGAGDRPHPERLERLGHLHGPVEPVVIGQGQGRVALLGRRTRELHRVRRPIEEGEGRVAMELDVGHEHMFAHSQPPSLKTLGVYGPPKSSAGGLRLRPALPREPGSAASDCPTGRGTRSRSRRGAPRARPRTPRRGP